MYYVVWELGQKKKENNKPGKENTTACEIVHRILTCTYTQEHDRQTYR